MQAAGLEVVVNGPPQEVAPQEVAPHILSLSFTGEDAEMLLIRLNKAGVAVSMGSACTSQDIDPSHVLTAMGLPPAQIESTLRISLGLPTTANEINALLETLIGVIKGVPTR